jgi:hypothetical protein
VDGDNVQVDLNNPNECKNFLGEFNWNDKGKRMKINNYDSGHATSVLTFLDALYKYREKKPKVEGEMKFSIPVVNSVKDDKNDEEVKIPATFGLTVYWTKMNGKEECKFILKDGIFKQLLNTLSKQELAPYSDVINVINEERSYCKWQDNSFGAAAWFSKKWKGGKSRKYKRGKIIRKTNRRTRGRKNRSKSKVL